MYTLLEDESPALSSFIDDNLVDSGLTVPPPSPQSGEDLSGKLPSFDESIMGNRAWIKLVLWAYRLTV